MDLPSVLWILLLFCLVGPQGLTATNTIVDPGQLLMVGFNETQASEELISHLKKLKPGAVILFRRNIQSPEQLGKLIHTIEKEVNPFLPAPLVFAIDQEGGSVYRIPTNPRIPSPAALGKANDPELVEDYGRAIGKLLRRHGITMNLAPVLDLDIQSSFIGNRSFGTNPSLVAQLGYLFARGLAASGVIPTGKHFPGIGTVFTDPHTETPVSNLGWFTDWNRELLPFREFSRLTPSALMLSHVIYPKLDNQRLPASVSPYIIKKVLRDTLKYEGLVITDDLLMKGLTSQFDPSTAALASLNSGADLVMLSWSRKDQEKVYRDIKTAIEEKRLDPEDIKNKLDRLKKMKSLLAIKEGSPTLMNGWDSDDIQQLNQKLLDRTLALDKQNYKSISTAKNIYLFNLVGKWTRALQARLKTKAIRTLLDINQFKKLNLSEQEDSIIIYGIYSQQSLLNLRKLSAQELKRTVLILCNDIEIKDEDRFYSVFKPLWNFEGLPEKIAGYLF